MKFLKNVFYYFLSYFIWIFIYAYGYPLNSEYSSTDIISYVDYSYLMCSNSELMSDLSDEYANSSDIVSNKITSADIIDEYRGYLGIKGNYTNILSCMKYDNDCAWYYSGSLHIPVSMNLRTEEEALDEANFAALLQMHLDESEKEYKNLPESLNGKVISTDIACHLYQPYALDIEGRLRYLFSTRIPASWFANYLYYKRLMEVVMMKRNQQKAEQPTVVFLAGGDGSGKTSAVQHLNLSIIENADIIRDATMSSSLEFHCNVIEKTLELGLKVTIIYVFRPIELALEANILRAEEIGRVRPLTEIVDAHFRAQRNVLEFSEFFGDRVQLYVIDNSRTFEEIKIVDDPIAFLRSSEVYYQSKEEVFKRALLVYSNKNKEEIPETVRNLLECQLTTNDLYKNTTNAALEKERWYSYLKKFILDVGKKLGF